MFDSADNILVDCDNAINVIVRAIGGLWLKMLEVMPKLLNFGWIKNWWKWYFFLANLVSMVVFLLMKLWGTQNSQTPHDSTLWRLLLRWLLPLLSSSAMVIKYFCCCCWLLVEKSKMNHEKKMRFWCTSQRINYNKKQNQTNIVSILLLFILIIGDKGKMSIPYIWYNLPTGSLYI